MIQYKYTIFENGLNAKNATSILKVEQRWMNTFSL